MAIFIVTLNFMKKHKYKALYFTDEEKHNTAKNIFQWVRKGDVEATLLVSKGYFRKLSGYFAIADDHSTALLKLKQLCNRHILSGEMRFIPFNQLILTYSKGMQAGVV